MTEPLNPPPPPIIGAAPGDLDALFGDAGNDDFDPPDTDLEVKDRNATGAGDSGFVLAAQSVNDILNVRSFQ